MSAFDDLTLGDVEELIDTALKGQSLTDADPLMLAGGVMWMTERRTDPGLSWEAFKSKVSMGAIKDFSVKMREEEEAGDPTSVQ